MNEALQGARTLLSDATPLTYDCGALCGHACCHVDSDGQGGVMLFPGEAETLLNAPWASLHTSPDGSTLLNCLAPCPRELRPLGCRWFPLTPVRRSGIWTVRLDQRAWAMCPLMPGGLKGLNPVFVQAAREAVAWLATDRDMRACLTAWARDERAFHVEL